MHLGGSPKFKAEGSGCSLWPSPLEPLKRRGAEGRARLSGDGPALGKQGRRGRWSGHRAWPGGGVAGRRRKVVGIGGRLLPSVRLSWGPEEAGGGGERERQRAGCTAWKAGERGEYPEQDAMQCNAKQKQKQMEIQEIKIVYCFLFNVGNLSRIYLHTRRGAPIKQGLQVRPQGGPAPRIQVKNKLINTYMHTYIHLENNGARAPPSSSQAALGKR